MKVASLLILLPAAAADSQSVNQARSVNPNLRGGGRKQSHRHEGHSLLEEFRQQRVHKKDVIEEEIDDPNAADQAVVDAAVGAGEQSVGAGKYFDHDNDHLHEKSLARKKKARQNVFRTSRLSRGEMEKRAEEMKSKLQQVEEGTLQLNEKTVDRYKKFVDRYNELEKEIYLMNHPEEKEKEEEDAKQHTANTGSNTEAAEEKKSTSAYSSGKAEYEKSIEQMKEKKEMDVMNAMIQKDKEVSGSSSVAKVVTEGGGEEKDTKKVATPGKSSSSEYVYAADGSKQMKTMDDDDDISQLEKPDESGSKGNKGTDFEVVSKGGKSSTPNEDDDIPPNFEGLAEGKMATNTAEKTSTKTVVVSKGNKSDADDQDDDIPPNWEGLVDGIGPHDVVSEGVTVEEEEPEEETVANNTRQRGNDEIPTDISVEDSLGKVKKLADKVGSTAEEVPKKSVEKKVKTAQKDEEGDTEETPVAVGKTATTPLQEEGGDDGAEDAGTDEIMVKDTLPKLEPETSEGQKSVERGMNADGEER